MKTAELKDKKILILGFGREGIDTFNFLRKAYPQKPIGIADKANRRQLSSKAKNIIKKDKKLKLYLGKDYLNSLKRYEVIIRSPGVAPKTIKTFLTKRQRLTSQAGIFFEECPGEIIGVTGTKGKSTTASLIYEILKKNGIKAKLAGNIGKPMLSMLGSARKDTYYVLELSSHQLLDLKKSPHIAVLLNIFPEHLDYYEGFTDYANSKARITRYQTKEDFLIFNPDNEPVKKIAAKSRARKISLASVRLPKRKFLLKGKFNLYNIRAAVAAARLVGLNNREIFEAVEKFKPLPHRLEYVGKYKGIIFYNDALSTIPEATLAALETLGNSVQTIFLGGFDRGLEFGNLVGKILNEPIKNIILFPETGERIWREMLKQTEKNEDLLKKHKVFLVQGMEDAVKLAYEFTDRGKVCLLSTASPSFGLFRDYREKGELFKKFVKKYGKD
jgi:UDP-N-acetylmuramoylalanine--D-glutamate ligase